MFVLFLLVSRSTLPRNAYFSWQTLNCQIVPVLPSYLIGSQRALQNKGFGLHSKGNPFKALKLDRVSFSTPDNSKRPDKESRICHNLSGPMRDTPPHRAIPFRDSIAEGGIPPICLVFIGYRAGIAEIPLLRGGIAPPLRMLSNWATPRKGGGGIAPNWPC